MVKKFYRIQFLLMSDGMSHQKMGTDQINALQELGHRVACYYPKRKITELIDKPDYVFVLKSGASELARMYKAQGSKIVAMISDERYPKESMEIFDFFLTISLDWQNEFKTLYPNRPCYLMKEEYDYCMTKKHTQDSFKIVTMGYAQCLKVYLKPILEQLKEKYQNNIHILTDWGVVSEVDNFCEGFHKDKFNISVHNMNKEGFDKARIEQYNQYDVGLVGSMDIQRPSNRLKSLMYAGLPVVALKTKNHTNVWFNETRPTVTFVKNNNWVEAIDSLQEVGRRQTITDYNYYLVQKNGGLLQTGKLIERAIKQYENIN